MSSVEVEPLIKQLLIRFNRKPRRCKKKNDSQVGTSEIIICVDKDIFYYYPKIQQFNDLDIHKLEYAIPKAGVTLSEIVELRFPPRMNNDRDYFEIIVPKNKILMFNKTGKEIFMDEFAEGQQTWKFLFDYDIVSLPEKQIKQKQSLAIEKKQAFNRKKKEQQQLFRKQEEKKKKLQQEYQVLKQAQKMMDSNDNDNQFVRKQKQNKIKLQIQQQIREADEFHFQVQYEKMYKNFITLEEQINEELELLEWVGKFKKRAKEVVMRVIDELPYIRAYSAGKRMQVENLLIEINDSKTINNKFLSQKQISHTVYKVRFNIQKNFRVPLCALIKYKGFKVLVRALTESDKLSKKEKQEGIIHGRSKEVWKSHFMVTQDLNIVLQNLNLKPYTTEAYFQKVTAHIGTDMYVVKTKEDSFKQIKQLSPNFQANTALSPITYIFNFTQVFPIDLNEQKNIDQFDVRLRPEFVKIFEKYANPEEKLELTGGAMMEQLEDEQGVKHDYSVAQASQTLKYIHLVKFVKQLDELQHIPTSSEHLIKIMKKHGINVRYLGKMHKLTKIPYLREMFEVEAIGREIKRIYRDHQKEFVEHIFKSRHTEMINEINNKSTDNSLKLYRGAELKIYENEQSVSNAIDFLNLVFGSGEESQRFWIIVKENVLRNYGIEIKEYMDLSHGYLLLTVLYHCGFEVKVSAEKEIFLTPETFTAKDWVAFTCKVKSLSFPSMKVYEKCKMIDSLPEEFKKNRLDLQLYLRRILYESEYQVLSQLSKYVPNLNTEAPQQSFQNLKLYLNNPTKENFEQAYQICNFVLPASHPFFQELYLKYAELKELDPILLKQVAERHAIRTLGITHWKTSVILTNYSEEAYIKHLLAAEHGVQEDKKIQLQKKIIEQQIKLGRLFDCLNCVQKAIKFVDNRDYPLNSDELANYLCILRRGIESMYKLRRINDLIRMSEYLWQTLEKYCYDSNYQKQLQFLFYYSLKAFLESSDKKHFLFKVILAIKQKIKDDQKKDKTELLTQLRLFCRQSKNHLNFIKEMIIKLYFGYKCLNFKLTLFLHFWETVAQLNSDEIQEGLYEFSLLYQIYGFSFFQETLLNITDVFFKCPDW